MKKGVVFLHKEIWAHLCLRGKSRMRGLICDLLSHSEVHTNIKKEDVLEDEDLLQAYNDNGGLFVFDFDDVKEQYIDSVDIVPLCSVYLVDNDNMYCDGKSSQHGLFVLNNNLLEKQSDFFAKKEVYVCKSEKYKTGWRNDIFNPILKGHKCNALILFDKYICKDGNISTMNHNLEAMLCIMLPDLIADIPYQISIYSDFDVCIGDDIYNQIKDCVKSLRPRLQTQLTLYQNKSDIHDRVILSNTFMIKSGAGFALFRDNGKVVNETNVEYYPYKRQEYYQRIRAAKEISIKSFANENMRNYWGDKENRLFELV